MSTLASRPATYGVSALGLPELVFSPVYADKNLPRADGRFEQSGPGSLVFQVDESGRYMPRSARAVGAGH